MLRNAVVIGIVSALVICAAFAFYVTDLSYSVGLSGEQVIVCHLPSQALKRNDEYAIACAKLVGWVMEREVVFDRPSPIRVSKPQDKSRPKPATGTFPVVGGTAVKSAATRGSAPVRTP